MNNKKIILFSLFLMGNPASILAELREYSMTNRMNHTAVEIHFHFVYPKQSGSGAKIEKYSASFANPLGSGQVIGWGWESMQRLDNGTYQVSYPYKIVVVWRDENGVKKSKTTCITEAWHDKAHWAIEADGSAIGFKGHVDWNPRPSIKMGPSFHCNISNDEKNELIADCCQFDATQYWSTNFAGE